jgi:hypothetical protein
MHHTGGVFAQVSVSVITNGNKAPGGWHEISQLIRFRRSNPKQEISLKKAAPPAGAAPFGDCYFYNHVLPLIYQSWDLAVSGG